MRKRRAGRRRRNWSSCISAGARVSDNLITDNRITNNGLPGIAFHAHSPGENLNNNQLIGNYIAGNGADGEDAETPGPTGINIFGA